MLSESTRPRLAFPDIARDEVFRIETRRMWLRWPRLADVACLVSWVGKSEVAQMTASWPVGIGADAVAERIGWTRTRNGDGRNFGFVLTLKGDGALAIGQAGVGFRDDGALGLGYHLDPDFWGRGLMTEAVSALTGMAFALVSAPRIEAGVMPVNPASRRVLVKCGFAPTGRTTWQSPVRGPIELETFALERATLRDSRRRGRATVPGPDCLARAC